MSSHQKAELLCAVAFIPYGSKLLGPHRSLVCLVDEENESTFTSETSRVLSHAAVSTTRYMDDNPTSKVTSGTLVAQMLLHHIEGHVAKHGHGSTILSALCVQLCASTKDTLCNSGWRYTRRADGKESAHAHQSRAYNRALFECTDLCVRVCETMKIPAASLLPAANQHPVAKTTSMKFEPPLPYTKVTPPVKDVYLSTSATQLATRFSLGTLAGGQEDEADDEFSWFFANDTAVIDSPLENTPDQRTQTRPPSPPPPPSTQGSPPPSAAAAAAAAAATLATDFPRRRLHPRRRYCRRDVLVKRLFAALQHVLPPEWCLAESLGSEEGSALVDGGDGRLKRAGMHSEVGAGRQQEEEVGEEKGDMGQSTPLALPTRLAYEAVRMVAEGSDDSVQRNLSGNGKKTRVHNEDGRKTADDEDGFAEVIGVVSPHLERIFVHRITGPNPGRSTVLSNAIFLPLPPPFVPAARNALPAWPGPCCPSPLPSAAAALPLMRVALVSGDIAGGLCGEGRGASLSAASAFLGTDRPGSKEEGSAARVGLGSAEVLAAASALRNKWAASVAATLRAKGVGLVVASGAVDAQLVDALQSSHTKRPRAKSQRGNSRQAKGLAATQSTAALGSGEARAAASKGGEEEGARGTPAVEDSRAMCTARVGWAVPHCRGVALVPHCPEHLLHQLARALNSPVLNDICDVDDRKQEGHGRAARECGVSAWAVDAGWTRESERRFLVNPSAADSANTAAGGGSSAPDSFVLVEVSDPHNFDGGVSPLPPSAPSSSSSQFATVLLCGPTCSLVDELEAAFWRTARRVRSALADGRTSESTSRGGMQEQRRGSSSSSSSSESDDEDEDGERGESRMTRRRVKSRRRAQRRRLRSGSCLGFVLPGAGCVELACAAFLRRRAQGLEGLLNAAADSTAKSNCEGEGGSLVDCGSPCLDDGDDLLGALVMRCAAFNAFASALEGVLLQGLGNHGLNAADAHAQLAASHAILERSLRDNGIRHISSYATSAVGGATVSNSSDADLDCLRSAVQPRDFAPLRCIGDVIGDDGASGNGLVFDNLDSKKDMFQRAASFVGDLIATDMVLVNERS